MRWPCKMKPSGLSGLDFDCCWSVNTSSFRSTSEKRDSGCRGENQREERAVQQHTRSMIPPLVSGSSSQYHQSVSLIRIIRANWSKPAGLFTSFKCRELTFTLTQKCIPNHSAVVQIQTWETRDPWCGEIRTRTTPAFVSWCKRGVDSGGVGAPTHHPPPPPMTAAVFESLAASVIVLLHCSLRTDCGIISHRARVTTQSH